MTWFLRHRICNTTKVIKFEKNQPMKKLFIPLGIVVAIAVTSCDVLNQAPDILIIDEEPAVPYRNRASRVEAQGRAGDIL